MRPHALGLLALLALQFLAGMLLNLFVQLPTRHPGSTGGEYFSRSWASLLWALVVHAALALLLFFSTLALFLRTLGASGRGARWGTGLAALFTLVRRPHGVAAVPAEPTG